MLTGMNIEKMAEWGPTLFIPIVTNSVTGAIFLRDFNINTGNYYYTISQFYGGKKELPDVFNESLFSDMKIFESYKRERFLYDFVPTSD